MALPSISAGCGAEPAGPGLASLAVLGTYRSRPSIGTVTPCDAGGRPLVAEVQEVGMSALRPTGEIRDQLREAEGDVGRLRVGTLRSRRCGRSAMGATGRTCTSKR